MNQVNNRNSQLRRAVVMTFIAAYQFSAFGTYIFIILQVGVTNPQRQLQPPTPAEGKMVAVGYPAAIQVAAIGILIKFGDKRNLADIVFRPKAVDAEEVTFKTLARPITELGLNQNMTQAHTVGQKCPRVIIAGNIKGGFMAQSNLNAQIRRRSGPISKVRFGCYVLAV